MTANNTISENATNRQHAKPLIGISMGDPSGIGAEVIVKALNDLDIRACGRFIIYGIEEILAAAADAANIKPFWFTVEHDQECKVDSGVVVSDYQEYPAGHWVNARPTEAGGVASLQFVDQGIHAAINKEIDALVTGPIHKTSWKFAGCKFPGHTEKIADACKTKRFTMAFVGGGIRIALASTHLGIFELRNQFKIGKVFQPIDLLHDALKNWFGIARPRIAVAGLNPHAGEDGLFGDEEARVIEPAMEMARNTGIQVEGPFPADTLFLPKNRNRFDGFVCMYHDQGLIPMKMLAFDTAVNVTLGLPIIRTSVDHGPAFDIAGTNQADPGSMKEAIRLACQLATNANATKWSTPPESTPPPIEPESVPVEGQ